MLQYDASRLRAFRVLATIVAGAVAVQSLRALGDHDSQAPNAWWNTVPLALAIAALALAWRKRPILPPVTFALFAAAATQAFALFGDSMFARIAVGVIVVLFVAFFAWAYLVLPLLAWHRGRWPVEPVDFAPLTHDDEMPEELRQRIRALAAVGFVPRLVHARAEGGASATIVVLAHGQRDAFATVSGFTLDGHTFTNTRLTRLPGVDGSVLSLTDAMAPAPFPAPPGHRVLLFPDADAATLLANFQRLYENAPARVLSDDELATAMAAVRSRYDRWLVDAGYLAATVDKDVLRYTLKGGFSAVLRPLWPWYPIQRARLARDGKDAMGNASGAGAA